MPRTSRNLEALGSTTPFERYAALPRPFPRTCVRVPEVRGRAAFDGSRRPAPCRCAGGTARPAVLAVLLTSPRCLPASSLPRSSAPRSSPPSWAPGRWRRIPPPSRTRRPAAAAQLQAPDSSTVAAAAPEAAAAPVGRARPRGRRPACRRRAPPRPPRPPPTTPAPAAAPRPRRPPPRPPPSRRPRRSSPRRPSPSACRRDPKKGQAPEHGGRHRRLPGSRQARRHGRQASTSTSTSGCAPIEKERRTRRRRPTSDDRRRPTPSKEAAAPTPARAASAPTGRRPRRTRPTALATPGPDAHRRAELLHRQVPHPALPPPHLPGRRHPVRRPLGGPRGDQRDRDGLRPQPQHLLRRRARLDAVHARRRGTPTASTPTATACKDPFNPVDAIFAAARYLQAAGAEHGPAPGDLRLQPRRLVRRLRPHAGARHRRAARRTSSARSPA